MGHSQADKAASKARILEAASQQIRDGGLESLSVGQLMRSAGLTHGGFYGHFASRADLLAQALAQALADGAQAARAASQGRPPSYSLRVRRYLSRSHRDHRAGGCAIGALAGDVARADDAVRDTMAQHVEALIASTAQSLGDDSDHRALLAVSAMVGALQIARALPDTRRSDAVLKAVRDQLLAMAPSDAADAGSA